MNIEELDFVTVVRLHFSFLENEFGFRVIGHNPMCVRYESDAVFIEVYLDPFFSIGLAINLLDQSKPEQGGYSIHYLVRLLDGESFFRYQDRYCRTKSEVDTEVGELSKLLRSCGERALRGCVDVFDAMNEIYKSDMGQSRTQYIRSDAESAFKKQDYHKAAELYSSMEPNLTATEAKKLAYARKHSME